jgi:hypothetical protein
LGRRVRAKAAEVDDVDDTAAQAPRTMV